MSWTRNSDLYVRIVTWCNDNLDNYTSKQVGTSIYGSLCRGGIETMQALRELDDFGLSRIKGLGSRRIGYLKSMLNENPVNSGVKVKVRRVRA